MTTRRRTSFVRWAAKGAEMEVEEVEEGGLSFGDFVWGMIVVFL
jgi:hypothetical protein